MHRSNLRAKFDPLAAGQELYAWAKAWRPIPRSLTGEGIRAQLRALQEHVPLKIHEVPSGTPVFDWTVPREWNVREAWIKAPDGQKVADFAQHPLQLLGYSVPFRGKLSLDELKEYIYTLPERPDDVPYRTSYYRERWGFCLAHTWWSAFPEGEYEVCVDTTLEDGHLSYGEVVLPGETKEEVLISAHACHPVLANDNLSGLAIATWLARALAGAERRYTYRFVFAPGTIGAITWLAFNEHRARRIKHGLVLACLGDRGHTTYKLSRQGDAAIDRAVRHVLEHSGAAFEVQPFVPYGYDERQYCSPGFNLPVGCFMRTPPGAYPEYHTSADNLDLITPEALADSLGKLLQVIEIIEGDTVCSSLSPKCEPQLGKRGLYGSLGGTAKDAEMALLWVLNYSDGEHSLLDIAERADLPFSAIREAADRLLATDLLVETGGIHIGAPGPLVFEEREAETAAAAPETAADDFWEDFLDLGIDKRKPGEAAQDDED